MRDTATLAREVLKRHIQGQRMLVAIAGAPGSGKSTLASNLVSALQLQTSGIAALVPMDGFHYDNSVLAARGLLARKGAPETFDAAGFVALLSRIAMGTEDVAIPVFERSTDLSRAGAVIVHAATRIIIVEGNYLLLDADPWRRAKYDLAVFIDVPAKTLQDRLLARWLHCGFSPEAALARASANDMSNAAQVIAGSRAADLVLKNG